MAEDRAEQDLDDYALSPELFDQLFEALEAEDAARIEALFEPLHAADIADVLEQIEQRDRRVLLSIAGSLVDGEVLSEIREEVRDEVLDLLNPDDLALAVRDLESDDVVDLVEDLDEELQGTVLGALEGPDRIAVERALSWPEESAGRLMQVETVHAPHHWSVGEMIDYLRENPDRLPDQFYHIILVDPRMKPVGNVTLGRMLSSRRDVKLADIAEEMFRTIPAMQDEGEVAYAFNQYHLISAPVVDENDRLVGVITIDDAMIVLDQEHEEDILRLAGVRDVSSLSDSVLETVRGRATWLMVNLLTAIFASVVIDLFADTIDQMVALAVLMPIVASMGGNAGTQTMTVAVRAIATRDLTGQNAVRIIRRELVAGAMNGVLFGVLMAAVATAWFGVPMLALVIGVAMLLTQIAAAFGGIVIPIVLDRFRIDPALASGPFVTTVTDVVGFFAFLSLATTVLL